MQAKAASENSASQKAPLVDVGHCSKLDGLETPRSLSATNTHPSRAATYTSSWRASPPYHPLTHLTVSLQLQNCSLGAPMNPIGCSNSLSTPPSRPSPP